MRVYVVLSCWASLVLAGCAAKTTNLTPSPTEQALKDMPAWFLTPPTDPNLLFAAATMTSRDMQMSLQKAKAQAQADLAQQLETRMANLTKQFQEEVGSGDDSELLQQFTSATKIVTSQTLNGAKVEQQQLRPEEGIYRAYVLMSLPIGSANQALMEKIRANEALHTRFRATQAFEELNHELEQQATPGAR